MRPIKALRADGMPIGELSRLCGVNIETIRTTRKSRCYPPRCAPKRVIGSMGQKKRASSSSSAAGGNSDSLSIKSAPCSILAGRERRHAPRCGKSLNITSGTSAQRLMILPSLNACRVRRSRNVPAGSYQIAPCWIFSMSKVSGHPAHSAVLAQARSKLRKAPIGVPSGSSDQKRLNSSIAATAFLSRFSAKQMATMSGQSMAINFKLTLPHFRTFSVWSPYRRLPGRFPRVG